MGVDPARVPGPYPRKILVVGVLSGLNHRENSTELFLISRVLGLGLLHSLLLSRVGWGFAPDPIQELVYSVS